MECGVQFIFIYLMITYTIIYLVVRPLSPRSKTRLCRDRMSDEQRGRAKINNGLHQARYRNKLMPNEKSVYLHQARGTEYYGYYVVL